MNVIIPFHLFDVKKIIFQKPLQNKIPYYNSFYRILYNGEDYTLQNIIISIPLNYVITNHNKKNYKISFFDQYLTIMRTGGDSTNFKSLYKKLKEDLIISKKFFKHFILCITLKILRKLHQFF